MEQETRIAVVGIIVENKEAVGEVNQILHDYSPYIIGRMGLPYEKKHVNIISVIVDAPADRISALSGIRKICNRRTRWASSFRHDNRGLRYRRNTDRRLSSMGSHSISGRTYHRYFQNFRNHKIKRRAEVCSKRLYFSRTNCTRRWHLHTGSKSQSRRVKKCHYTSSSFSNRSKR